MIPINFKQIFVSFMMATFAIIIGLIVDKLFLNLTPIFGSGVLFLSVNLLFSITILYVLEYLTEYSFFDILKDPYTGIFFIAFYFSIQQNLFNNLYNLL